MSNGRLDKTPGALRPQNRTRRRHLLQRFFQQPRSWKETWQMGFRRRRNFSRRRIKLTRECGTDIFLHWTQETYNMMAVGPTANTSLAFQSLARHARGRCTRTVGGSAGNREGKNMLPRQDKKAYHGKRITYRPPLAEDWHLVRWLQVCGDRNHRRTRRRSTRVPIADSAGGM